VSYLEDVLGGGRVDGLLIVYVLSNPHIRMVVEG